MSSLFLLPFKFNNFFKTFTFNFYCRQVARIVQITPKSLHPESSIIRFFYISFPSFYIYIYVIFSFFLNHLRLNYQYLASLPLKFLFFHSDHLQLWGLWAFLIVLFIFSLLTVLLRYNWDTIQFILDCIFIPSFLSLAVAGTVLHLAEQMVSFGADKAALWNQLTGILYLQMMPFLSESLGWDWPTPQLLMDILSKRPHFCPILWM